MRAHLFSVLAAIVSAFIAMGSVTLFAQGTSTEEAPLLSLADLEQLVAPIALYPDPMVALILPAATVPTDIVLAQRYLQDGNDPSGTDQQNWDDSVKGLARYPDVLQMMDENLDWTNQLGAAVLAQQDDVMTAIQAMRAKAYALGNLETNSQQQVIDDNQIIQIVPADPQVIYVPVYDPQVIYIERDPSISFGLGLAMGAWIGGGCDWSHHGIYSQGYYRPGYGWRPNNITININIRNVWRPNPSRPRPRPPYNPGRLGNGHLPGWNRPPGGKPGNGHQPGGNRPPGSTKPGKPPIGGNKPGNGHGPSQGNRPPGTIKPHVPPPVGGNDKLPGATKPGIRPKPGGQTGTPRPGNGGSGGKEPQVKPTHPKPDVNRPAITKPSTPAIRPGVSRPAENTKRPKPSARPAPQRQAQVQKPQRAAPQRSAPAADKGKKK